MANFASVDADEIPMQLRLQFHLVLTTWTPMMP
jgi:hypothetical protein